MAAYKEIHLQHRSPSYKMANRTIMMMKLSFNIEKPAQDWTLDSGLYHSGGIVLDYVYGNTVQSRGY